MEKKFKGAFGIGMGILILIILAVSYNQIIGNNDAGFYIVKQDLISGKLSIVNEPGMFFRGFAKLTKYKISDMQYFSKSDIDGGTGLESDAINVRFNDGGTAIVSGSLRYRLSEMEKDRLELHRDYRSDDAIKNHMVRQVVQEALLQTATLLKAEEAYSSRRSDFTAIAESQIKEGIYETLTKEEKVEDVEGNDFIEKKISITMDENGNPKVRKPSPFKTYNIQIIQFSIKDIDFDETIDALISKKKEAEQQRVVAKAAAERAKQDAITAEEQGKARIAVAKADEEVEKIKAVTRVKKEKEVEELRALKEKNVAKLTAEKELEVAKLAKESAEQEAMGMLVKKEAEAKANRLLVQAGLTPSEKAQIDKDIKIGVARELSKIALPKIVISGGSGNGKSDPMDAVGLKMLLEINDRLIKEENTK